MRMTKQRIKCIKILYGIIFFQIMLLLDYSSALAACPSAQYIDVNAKVDSSIIYCGDVDYFSFTLPARGSVRIDGNMALGNLIEATLYNSTCTSSLANGFLNYPNTYFYFPSLAAGTYFLKVEGNYYSTLGNYWIYVGYNGENTSPEMDVKGAGYSISDGDTSPSGHDGTLFDYVYKTKHTFSIVNTGTAELNLTDSPYVSITGTHVEDFNVTQQPSSPINVGGSTTFEVRFQPTSSGLRNATISIANDDNNENPYNFAITGDSYLLALYPEIEVQSNGIEITNGDTTPNSADNTDLGTVDISTGPITHTFTIANNGGAELNLTGVPIVSISGTHASNFNTTVLPNSSVAIDGTTTFQITFEPNSVGLCEAVISIENNDSNENPYEFTVQGTSIIPDSDGDGLNDLLEQSSYTDYLDSDTDDDGILDGMEDINQNGIVDDGETDPCVVDSDEDGIQDGTELGYTLSDMGTDTNPSRFIPDADPSTTTDPADSDTDDDGFSDGLEDSNFNGMIDLGETDPSDDSDFPVPEPIVLEKIVPSDGDSSENFGYSVSINGQKALIGAYQDDDNGSLSGSAYVLRWNGSTWVEEQKLSPLDGDSYDYFGLSVSIDGDIALIGTPQDEDNQYSGTAYIFRWNGSSWVQEQKLLPSDGDYATKNFGYSVSISGGIALIGAFQDDDNGSSSGSAYIFRWNGSSWVQKQKLLPSDGVSSANFGYSVSIKGETALIGANDDDDNGHSSGSAYIFRWNGSSWVEEQKLLPSDGNSSDHFGCSVSISGDTALIGADWDDDNGSNSGSAYIFSWNDSSWVQEQKLLPSDGVSFANFGYSVSIKGETALIGAFQDDDNGYSSGSAYIFHFEGNSWMEEQKLLPSDGESQDCFGYSVSISEENVLIGSHQDDDNGANSGSAYIGVLSSSDDLMLQCMPLSLSVSCAEGQNASTQSFEIWNSGGGSMNYSVSYNVSWLSGNPTTGSSSGEHDTISVSYDTDELQVGTYTGTITIEAPGADQSPKNIAVTLTVESEPAQLEASSTSLNQSCAEGQNASSQSFEIWNSGGDSMSYSASDNVSWLSVNPTTGLSSGEHDTISVSYDTDELQAGTHTGTITIEAPGADQSPKNISVTLVVQADSVQFTAITWSGDVYKIDPQVGEYLFIGSSGYSRTNSLAVDKFGRLITAVSPLDDAAFLVEIDPITGNGKPIITILGPLTNVRALASSQQGELFACDTSSLYKINIETGQASTVGETSPNFQGLDFSSDGTLFGWNVSEGLTGGLYIIDTDTGETTDVDTSIGWASDYESPQTIVFAPDGTLYGANFDWFQIDSSTGVANHINAIEGCVRGVAVYSTTSNDEIINIENAIWGLRISSGFRSQEPINLLADVDDDGKIGVEEVISILQKTSGLRQ